MMLSTVACALLLVGAEPTADRSALLEKFRSEFVELTPGKGDFAAEFVMGSDSGPAKERPARRVKLVQPFAIARYEVTQELWQAVMGENPSRWKGTRNSVEMLTFAEAVEFCERATKLLREAELIEANQVVRLPSEAEWEYAARAGTTTKYSFGDDAKELGDFAWFTGNAAGNDPAVGAKKPNPWKLYDVHGYLWEWCSDEWSDNYEGAPTNGSARGKPDGRYGVLRGGSWKDPADHCTSTFRLKAARTVKDDAVGLRCVLAIAKALDGKK